MPKRTIKKAFGGETLSALRPDDRVAAVSQKRSGQRATSLLDSAPMYKTRRRARSIIDAYGIEVIALKAAFSASATARSNHGRAAANSLRDGALEPRGILAGRIYDDRGNRVSPTHSNKLGVRYRYYVSRALLQNRGDEAGSVPRVPAPEIEQLVVDGVLAHLSLPELPADVRIAT
jgi:hypothetical protein